MLAEVVDAVIGIDTHRDTHEVEIADAAGKPITVLRIGSDSAGFAGAAGIAGAAEQCCLSLFVLDRHCSARRPAELICRSWPERC